MSNLNHTGRADFTPCGDARSFDSLTARRGLTAPGCANALGGCSESERTEHREARFALVAAVAGIAMWAFLVYELASKLQVPSIG